MFRYIMSRKLCSVCFQFQFHSFSVFKSYSFITRRFKITNIRFLILFSVYYISKNGIYYFEV
jgi:hypothetical protein